MRPGLYRRRSAEVIFPSTMLRLASFPKVGRLETKGQIIHNQDGGPIWTQQRTSTGNDLLGINMNFAPLGWAVGRDGIVQRTINGGGYWKYHETDTGYDLHDVSFINEAKRMGCGTLRNYSPGRPEAVLVGNLCRAVSQPI